jgi:hypothetical protein
VLRSADLATAPRGRTAERQSIGRVTPGRLLGSVLIALIYAVAVFASRGLFDTPATDASRTAYRLLGLLNVAILPMLILAMIAGIRHIWLAGAPHPRLARLLIAPLWASFILSLLTVPLWMGMANVERQAAAPAASGYSTTFLLAPWGFMVAYGLALVVAGVMFDGTFPVAVGANSQPNTAGLG